MTAPNPAELARLDAAARPVWLSPHTHLWACPGGCGLEIPIHECQPPLALLERTAELEAALAEAHWGLVMWIDSADDAYVALLDRIVPLVSHEASIRADEVMGAALAGEAE